MYTPYDNMRMAVVKQYLAGEITREQMVAKLDEIERGKKDEA